MNKKLSLEQKRARTGYIFILPWLLGLLFFFAVPILTSLMYSFSHVTIVQGGVNTRFAGLSYYKNALFSDERFIPLLVAALKEIAIQVPIIIIFALFISVMLNAEFYGRGLVRSIFFLPLMLSSSVLLSIINSDSYSGDVTGSSSVFMVSSFSIGDILTQAGLPSGLIKYLTSVIDSIFTMTWQSGVQIILFLAALQSIPPSLKEAASVEGATAWEYFWKITVPMISPMILVNIAFTVIDTFTSYSNGVMEFVTSQAANLHYSFSSAVTWIYFVVISLILFIVVGLFSRKVFYMND
mgnify:FL=1